MNIIDQLKEEEGFRGNPYKCPADKLTVGFGCRFPLSKKEAEMLLRMRLDDFYLELHNKLPWVRDMSQRRQEVLLKMSYNMGVPRLLKFRRMISALKKEDYNTAADEILDSDAGRKLTSRYTKLSNDMRNG